MHISRFLLWPAAIALLATAACSPGASSDAGPTDPTAPVVTTPAATPATQAPAAENQEPPFEVSEESLESHVSGTTLELQDETLANLSEGSNEWWADDYCHYYVATDGQTYGDLCLGQVVENGYYVPHYYVLHQFDNRYEGNRGAALAQMYTGYPGWAMYRDWTEPALQNSPQVAWILHPADDSQVNADNFYVIMNDGSMYTVAYLTALAQAAVAGQAQAPAGLPAWDPAFMPINQLALSLIYNVQANTNPGIW